MRGWKRGARSLHWPKHLTFLKITSLRCFGLTKQNTVIIIKLKKKRLHSLLFDVRQADVFHAENVVKLK